MDETRMHELSIDQILEEFWVKSLQEIQTIDSRK
jgi:hypothetical protein